MLGAQAAKAYKFSQRLSLRHALANANLNSSDSGRPIADPHYFTPAPQPDSGNAFFTPAPGPSLHASRNAEPGFFSSDHGPKRTHHRSRNSAGNRDQRFQYGRVAAAQVSAVASNDISTSARLDDEEDAAVRPPVRLPRRLSVSAQHSPPLEEPSKASAPRIVPLPLTSILMTPPQFRDALTHINLKRGIHSTSARSPSSSRHLTTEASTSAVPEAPLPEAPIQSTSNQPPVEAAEAAQTTSKPTSTRRPLSRRPRANSSPQMSRFESPQEKNPDTLAYIDAFRTAHHSRLASVVHKYRQQGPISAAGHAAAIRAIALSLGPKAPVDLVLQLYEEMTFNDFAPSADTHDHVIHILANAAVQTKEDLDATEIRLVELQTMRDICPQNLVADLVNHTKAIKGHVIDLRSTLAERSTAAFQLFKAGDVRFRPSYVRLPIMQLCVALGNTSLGLQIFRGYTSQQTVVPLHHMFAYALQLLKLSGKIEEAEVVFQQYRELTAAGSFQADSNAIQASDATMTRHEDSIWLAMLDIYFTAGRPADAVALLEEYIARAPVASSQVAGLVLSGLAINGEFDQLSAWLDQFLKRGLLYPIRYSQLRATFDAVTKVEQPELALKLIAQVVAHFTSRVTETKGFFAQLPSVMAQLQANGSKNLLAEALKVATTICTSVTASQANFPYVVRIATMIKIGAQAGLVTDALTLYAQFAAPLKSGQPRGIAEIIILNAPSDTPLPLLLDAAHHLYVAPEYLDSRNLVADKLSTAYKRAVAQGPVELSPLQWACLVWATVPERLIDMQKAGISLADQAQSTPSVIGPLVAAARELAEEGGNPRAHLEGIFSTSQLDQVFQAVESDVETAGSPGASSSPLTDLHSPLLTSVASESEPQDHQLGSPARPSTPPVPEYLPQNAVGQIARVNKRSPVNDIRAGSWVPMSRSQALYILDKVLADAATGRGTPTPSICHLLLRLVRIDGIPLDTFHRLYLIGYHSIEHEKPAAQQDRWVHLEDTMLIVMATHKALDKVAIHRDRLMSAGFSPTADAYAAMILNANDTTDDATVALELFEESQRLGVRPNTYLFNNLLSRLSKARRTKEVLEVFQAMKELNLQPTAVTYGAVINACCKVGDEETAERMFEEMAALNDFVPRVPPFNTMIQFFVSTKPNRDKALQYYKRLLEFGVKPTAHTYKLLLDAYGLLQPVDPASLQAVFTQLERDGDVMVENVHWASLINSYGVEQLDLPQAIKIFVGIASHSDSQGAGPDAVCYEALLNACFANKRYDLVQENYDRMLASGVHSTAYVENTRIRALGAAGHLEAARQVFNALSDPPSGVAAIGNHAGNRRHSKKAAAAPSDVVYREPSTYETMLKVEVAAGELEQAERVLQMALHRAFPVPIMERLRQALADATLSAAAASEAPAPDAAT